MNRTELKQFIEATFNEEELRTLYFDFGIDFDEGKSREEIVESLLAFVVAHDCLEELQQQPSMQLRLIPQSISSARIDLIRLYTAMGEQLDEAAVDQLCLVLKVQGARIKGLRERDKIRQLLLWAKHRERIPEVIQRCREIKGEFHWQDVALPFPVISPSEEVVDGEWLFEPLANRFTAQELHQLAFYLDFDADSTGHLVDRLEAEEVPRIRRWLAASGIVGVENMTAEALADSLRKEWIKAFIRYCRLTRMTAQAIAVCRYLKPALFA